MRNYNLSKREVEVLQLAANGLANQGIADKLTCSERTVRTHLSSAYDKLGTVNCGRSARVEAINQGIRLGLIVRAEESQPEIVGTLLADLAYLRKHIDRMERILQGVAHGQR